MEDRNEFKLTKTSTLHILFHGIAWFDRRSIFSGLRNRSKAWKQEHINTVRKRFQEASATTHALLLRRPKLRVSRDHGLFWPLPPFSVYTTCSPTDERFEDISSRLRGNRCLFGLYGHVCPFRPIRRSHDIQADSLEFWDLWCTDKREARLRRI